MAIEKYRTHFINNTQGFTILITKVIQSIKDFDVLGLYVYLASKPSTWKPHVTEIRNHTGYSKDKVYRLINKLMELGLLTRAEQKNEGCFKSIEYTLHLSPCTPCPDFPCTGFTDTENQDTYKREIIENKENINNTLVREEKKQDLVYQETYYPNTQELKQHAGEQAESDATFEAFWEMYPVKKGKARAKTAWFSQKCYKMVHMILTKLNVQIKEDRQYIEGYAPHPSTYINQMRWQDEITRVVKKPYDTESDLDWEVGLGEMI